MHWKKGNYHASITDFTEADPSEPEAPERPPAGGAAFEVSGDLDKAIADFTETIRLDPRNWAGVPRAWFGLRTQRDDGRAIADLDAGCYSRPKTQPLFYSRQRLLRIRPILTGPSPTLRKPFASTPGSPQRTPPVPTVTGKRA